MIYDATKCALGEGPLWHPEREELFWFDITNSRLLSKNGQWQFSENVSASGWVDKDNLLIASASALLHFNLETGAQSQICALEADNALTRANDGRADPWGGFWIGTMGRQAEKDAGAIYRYFRGELRQLYAPMTIPNSICFSPDGTLGYFADTTEAKVWKQPLGPYGWPKGAPEIFLDLRAEGLNPDGAVCDTHGNFWNAQWGAARVARYLPDGRFDGAESLPTDHITCPAFGGANRQTLFATSATQGLPYPQADAGKTFFTNTAFVGQAEFCVTI